MTNTICTSCGAPDSYVTNGDNQWCGNCGDTEGLIELSNNQARFMEDAEKQGFDIEFYSGRFMYGEKCPAVRVEGVADFHTEASYKTDEMGLGYIVYADF